MECADAAKGARGVSDVVAEKRVAKKNVAVWRMRANEKKMRGSGGRRTWLETRAGSKATAPRKERAMAGLMGVRSRFACLAKLSFFVSGTRDARRPIDDDDALSLLPLAPPACPIGAPGRVPFAHAHSHCPPRDAAPHARCPPRIVAPSLLSLRSCSMFVCLFFLKIPDRSQAMRRARRASTHTPPQHMSKMVLGHPCDLKSSSLICRTRACAPQNARVWG